MNEKRLDRAHNEHVLPMLDALFKDAGVAKSAVDVVGFGCGPGSFTGARLGASITQAIAFASEARVVPVRSSQIWAYSVKAHCDHQGLVLTSVRSRGDAYYLALFRVGLAADVSDQVQRLQDDELCTAEPGWLVGSLASTDDCLLVGDRPPWLTDASLADLAVQPSVLSIIEYVTAQHVIGKSLDPQFALPYYTDGDSPWVKSVDR